MKTIGIAILSVAELLAVISARPHGDQMASAAEQNSKMQESVVDANGNLRVPTEYRTSYQYLGSWAIAATQGQGSKELHIVYASPGAVAAYRQKGRFSDGAVLVKEVYQTATQPMSTGTVSRAGTLQGWFVMVKESKDTHPDNQLWGDGWAWSWFDAGNPVKTTSNNYRLQCLPCHEPARGTDLVYVGGYPPLNGAK
jgi:Cytochrome P460